MNKEFYENKDGSVGVAVYVHKFTDDPDPIYLIGWSYVPVSPG